VVSIFNRIGHGQVSLLNVLADLHLLQVPQIVIIQQRVVNLLKAEVTHHFLLTLSFERLHKNRHVAIARKYLLRKRNQNNCQLALLLVRVQHVAEGFESSTMWTAVHLVTWEFELVGQRLKIFCLLDPNFTKVTIEELVVNDIVCQ